VDSTDDFIQKGLNQTDSISSSRFAASKESIKRLNDITVPKFQGDYGAKTESDYKK